MCQIHQCFDNFVTKSLSAFLLALSVKYVRGGARWKRSGKINQQIVFLSALMGCLIWGEISKLWRMCALYGINKLFILLYYQNSRTPTFIELHESYCINIGLSILNLKFKNKKCSFSVKTVIAETGSMIHLISVCFVFSCGWLVCSYFLSSLFLVGRVGEPDLLSSPLFHNIWFSDARSWANSGY